MEGWSGDGESRDMQKVTPQNPRFTQLTQVEKMKLEKAVQHRLTTPLRLSSIDPSKIKIEKAMGGVWGFQDMVTF